MKPVVLKSERIILRPLKMSDAKVLVKYINDPNVNRYLCNVKSPVSLKDERKFIRKGLKSWGDGSDINWGVEHKELKQLIGGCALHIDKKNNAAEYGLWLAKSLHGQGFGKEMSRLAIDFGFRKLKLNKICYHLDTRNRASDGLIKSLGGKREGWFHKARKIQGKYYDEYAYSILRREWKK